MNVYAVQDFEFCGGRGSLGVARLAGHNVNFHAAGRQRLAQFGKQLTRRSQVRGIVLVNYQQSRQLSLRVETCNCRLTDFGWLRNSSLSS